MNIQIFGKKKCFETKKAERYFKERKIKVQSIDILDKGMSPKEYESVKRAVGGVDALLDPTSSAYKAAYMDNQQSDAAKEAKLLDDPDLFCTPIVRNGKQATVGYQPEIWKTWKD
ncbi:MAG: arsenate reductase family protein [Erysipelotrichaceae bacterium]